MPVPMLPAVPALQAPAPKPCLLLSGHRFLLPAGWSASPLDGGKVLLKAPGAAESEVLAVVPAPPDALDALAQPDPVAAIQKAFAELASEATLLGTPQKLNSPLGPGVGMAFEGDDDGVRVTVRFWIAGRGGKGVVLMAAGPGPRVAALRPALDRLFASVVPAESGAGKKAPAPRAAARPKPAPAPSDRAAASWTTRLSGATLVMERTNFRDGSGESSRIALRFAADGTFTATIRKTISLNVGGAYAGSGFSDKTTEGAGTWRVRRQGAGVVLELVEKEGTSRFRLDQKGGTVTLDGYPTTLSR